MYAFISSGRSQLNTMSSLNIKGTAKCVNTQQKHSEPPTDKVSALRIHSAPLAAAPLAADAASYSVQAAASLAADADFAQPKLRTLSRLLRRWLLRSWLPSSFTTCAPSNHCSANQTFATQTNATNTGGQSSRLPLYVSLTQSLFQNLGAPAGVPFGVSRF